LTSDDDWRRIQFLTLVPGRANDVTAEPEISQRGSR
jgi:hypothetical protein